MTTHRTGPLPMLGEQLPTDPFRRHTLVYDFGVARALHLGDYLGPVRGLRKLSATADVDLVVTIAGDLTVAREVAATLVACGLGAATFRHGNPHRAERRAELPPGIPVGDLCRPRVPMGTAELGRRGVIQLLDGPLRLGAAVRAAQVDLDPLLGYDPQLRPGVSNLATILGGLTDRTPIAALYGLRGATELRTALTAALRVTLDPVRSAYASLAADPLMMQRIVSAAAE